MKKLLLLTAANCIAIAGFSQIGNSSIMFTQGQNEPNGKVKTDVRPNSRRDVNTANKGTGGPQADWFNYAAAMTNASSQGYYYNLYQDTTPKVFPSGNPAFHNPWHGMGFSFDPTSRAFDSSFLDPNACPDYVITNNNAYQVDSISFSAYYSRKPYNNYIDTMFIELARTQPSNASMVYRLQFTSSSNGANLSSDGIPRFVSPLYDPIRNKMSDSIPAADKRTWRIILDAAFFADSTAGNNHGRALSLLSSQQGTVMQVAAGEKLAIFMHFASGHVYPFAMNVDSVNTLRSFAYEPYGNDTWTKQFSQEVSTGLIATRQAKYGAYYLYNGHKILIPSNAYDNTAGFDAPDFGFFLRCTNCESQGIKNVASSIANVGAVPNPANNTLNIPVKVAQNGNVTVTILNTVGQVITTQNLGNVTKGNTATATFNTSNLANGMYIYSVDVNGQKVNGRVVIAH